MPLPDDMPDYQMPDSDCELDMDEGEIESYREVKKPWREELKELQWAALIEYVKTLTSAQKRQDVFDSSWVQIDHDLEKAYAEGMTPADAIEAYLSLPYPEVDPHSLVIVDGDGCAGHFPNHRHFTTSTKLCLNTPHSH